MKLLRVLQEHEITRLGGTQPSPVDLRIIAATNSKLSDLVEQKSFREDLYYRLNVIPVHLPPLGNVDKIFRIWWNFLSISITPGTLKPICKV